MLEVNPKEVVLNLLDMVFIGVLVLVLVQELHLQVIRKILVLLLFQQIVLIVRFFLEPIGVLMVLENVGLILVVLCIVSVILFII